MNTEPAVDGPTTSTPSPTASPAKAPTSNAVAELIEAARRVDRTDRGLNGWHEDSMPEAMQRLRAALVRVQEGAA